MSKKDLINELKELALGTRLKRLSDSLMNDVGKIYKELQLDFEPKWFTMLYLLNQTDALTINEIADHLKLSHPAVVQFADQMQKNNLIVTKRSKTDARKRFIALSAKGKEVFIKLQPVLIQIEKSTHELVKGSGINLMLGLEKMEHQLASKSMYQRIQEGLQKDKLAAVKLVNYKPKFKNHFKQLNEEWLLKYFKLEKQDKLVLNQPEEIIANGGEIIFALVDGNPVGTVALTKKEKAVYELNKMAVTQSFQGKHIGHALMKKIISLAKTKKAKEVFLETNRKLLPAIHLYEKHGFEEAKFSKKSSYERSNLKMVYKFNRN